MLGTLRSYATGFLLSLLLTLAAYFLVALHLLPPPTLYIAVGLLALAQSWLQLVYFLHLLKEPTPRWGLLIFLFMVMVTLILVIGSLWIMSHLSYNLMPA
jgi:cytochrome o ubiquinol oxidase operon protein cyoD